MFNIKNRKVQLGILISLALIFTALAVYLVYYFVDVFTNDYPIITTVFSIIGILVFFLLLIVVLFFIVKNGYRKHLATRIMFLVILLGTSIPLWLLFSDPIQNAGRNTVEIQAYSLYGNINR